MTSGNRIVGSVDIPSLAVSGTIANAEGVIGCISQENKVTGNLATAYTMGTVAYEGDYEVTPQVDGQELKTKHKYMTDDVTIHAIPYFEVSNTVGGITVYIADQIEME